MIVKYLNGEKWNYIDGIKKITVKNIDCEQLIKEYNLPDYYLEDRTPIEIINANKVFLMATEDEDICDKRGGNNHAENLLDVKLLKENSYSVIITLEQEIYRNVDQIVLVTNQKCFIMNDYGITVERII
jgi:hypothetical protein